MPGAKELTYTSGTLFVNPYPTRTTAWETTRIFNYAYPRIYHPEPLTSHSHIALCEDAANHIGRVLRMGPGQALQLFDGSNQVFDAEITSASKKSVEVKVLEGKIDDRESPLHIHLGQVMSRGEKMEFTIQKSIELGVSLITPLFLSAAALNWIVNV